MKVFEALHLHVVMLMNAVDIMWRVYMRMYRKLKDQERQGQLIKGRIEERKRRKQQQQETSLTENGTVVVHVNESNDSFDSLKY